jgi:hypothetical protein
MNLGNAPQDNGTGTAMIANYMPSIFTSVPDLLASYDGSQTPVPAQSAAPVPSIMGFPLTQKNILILLALYLFLRR